PWPGAPRPAEAGRTADGRIDLRGVVHVHTRASHDSPGRIEDVVAAARDAGLAWVALTEHTEPGRQGSHGWFGDVIVIPGFEIKVKGGSIHALGVTRPPSASHDPDAVVRWIHAQRGVAVVGHLEKGKIPLRDAFPTTRPDAVELANLHANAAAAGGGLAWRALLLPTRTALRALLTWPAVYREGWQTLPGPPALVGGVDAHARLRALGALGGTIDRYREVFRLLTTHVLARERSAEGVLQALRAGHSYVAFEGFAPVERFRFERVAEGFVLEAPRPARLALVCDGAEIARAEAARAVLAPPAGAARCRAEAWLGDRPWVFTSGVEVE
ncbi:MAG: PHP domain-containing protein, partial [Myxococcota bacterium]